MKLSGLLIASLVLAALIGALYWSNHHKPAENPQVSANTSPKVLSLKQDDISKLTLKKDGEETVGLAKDSSGQWQITSPQTFRANQDAVTGILATLSNLNGDRLIAVKTSNPSEYGLTHPSAEADITNKDGKTNTLLIGDSLPAGGGSYAAVAGDPRVFSIASYNATAIDKSVNDLRDKRLLTIDADKVSQLELLTKKQDLEFGRNKDEWQILKPKPLRADSFAAGNLVRQLTDAKMDLTVPAAQAKDAASDFASGTPVATAKLTDESGTQELQVRKNKNDYYAKSSITAGAYKISNMLGESMNKGLEDFRNKKLFDFGYADPDKVELHNGSKAYYLTRSSNGDWWSADRKKMDIGTVQSFLDRLRDLSASSFPDSGFTSPEITLSVVSEKGKRQEKVLLAKAGNGYIAKRENGPSLYQLDSSAVDDLLKSAADLKEAAPPKK